MAHIKVRRRSMKPEEYVSLRFGWLKRYIYEEKIEISNLEITDARQVSEMNYEYYPGGYRPLKQGDLYFTPDGTVFIRGDAVIPSEWSEREVYFSLKTASEMIVKINGKYVGGLDPNRERILISPYVDSNDLHFEIMGYNRSKPDDERNPASLSVRGCRQIFDGGFLCLVNDDVLSLIYDLELLLDAALSESFDEDFSAMVIKHLDSALDLVDFDDFKIEDVRLASRYIEEHIYANKNYKGSGKVALIGHSHLDIAYYWRRIHTVQKNLRTVLIQLRLMDRYPDFKYAHTQPYTYETLEKYYPEVFAELCEKIRAGQFEPCGAMYVEPDCNIPSAESLIRQCLYGQLYYREKFGFTVDNCWLPDVFGNSWILPQILKKSGVNYFVSNKMSTWNDTNRFPHNNFLWRGIDGTEIFACVPPTHFISWNEPSQIKENWDAYQDKDNGGATMQMFGYGDGGSGCTEEMIELMHRFKKLSVMPETEHMTGKDYLHTVFDHAEDLSVWDGELYLEMHRGTFTTKSYLKQMNRKLEFQFRNVEIISSIRHAKGEVYPAKKLRDLYKLFLINQFHDILPGSHITPVFRDAVEDLDKIDRELNEILPQNGDYFNTLNFPRTEPVFLPSEDGGTIRHGVRGKFQICSGEALSRVTLYTCGKDDWFHFDGKKIETDFYTANLEPDGSFSSLIQRENQREWVDGKFNTLMIFRDCPGNYDAWDILPDYTDIHFPITVQEPLTLLHADNTCVELSSTLVTEKSSWTRIIRFFRFSQGIEVENIVDWHEKHKLAKALFNVNVLSRELICDTSAGFIRRETHQNTSWQQARFEVCHHKWCDMAESDGGVALINEGKYGVGAKNNTVSLSLLRSTIRPDPSSDMGHHDFCYMIYPHSGSFLDAQINRKAFEYNVPLVVSDVDAIFQPLPEELYLQSLKLSEDEKSFIIRLSEQDGKRGSFHFNHKVCLLDMTEMPIQETEIIHYKPFEIITIGIEKEKLLK